MSICVYATRTNSWHVSLSVKVLAEYVYVTEKEQVKCVLQDDWKVAAERFIGKRGYAAAEKLRGSLQMEWQQLKAIRMRSCTASQVTFPILCLPLLFV